MGFWGFGVWLQLWIWLCIEIKEKKDGFWPSCGFGLIWNTKKSKKKQKRAQSQLWIWFAIWFYMNLITKKDSSLKVRLLLTPSSPRSFSNTETKQQMIRPYFLWPKLRFLTDTGGLTEGWIEQQTNYQTTLVSSLLLFKTLTQYMPIICLLLVRMGKFKVSACIQQSNGM